MKLDLSDKRVWQIGSGNDTRAYDDICIKFGIAMVGPGKYGDLRLEECKKRYLKENANQWGFVLKDVQKGDFVILRRGTKRILAVGEVIKEYDFSDLLADVQGWDLQHFIQVKWYKPAKEEIKLSETLLAQKTIVQVSSKEVLNRISKEDFTLCKQQNNNILKLKLPKEIKVDDISHSLVDSGVRIQDAENVTKTIGRIIKLAHWYMDNDDHALEHEIRTFLVVPLLISLGWSEQKIKIEYNNIDIAIFDKPFRNGNKQSPKIIIETKRFHDGLSLAETAVKNYAKKYQDCRLLIATNGFRYKLFVKSKDGFKDRGYFNLFDMREHYYLDKTIQGPIWSLNEISNL